MAEDIPKETELNVVRSAVRVGRHPATLDRALRNGELPFRWEDGRRLVKCSDLDAWASRTDRGRSAVSRLHVSKAKSAGLPTLNDQKPRTATAAPRRTY